MHFYSNTSYRQLSFFPPRYSKRRLEDYREYYQHNFNNSNIVSYFINWSVTNGLPAGNFKAINKSAEYLFFVGTFNLAIQYNLSKGFIYIKSNCLPEMRKDLVYNVCTGLEERSSDIPTGIRLTFLVLGWFHCCKTTVQVGITNAQIFRKNQKDHNQSINTLTTSSWTFLFGMLPQTRSLGGHIGILSRENESKSK